MQAETFAMADNEFEKNGSRVNEITDASSDLNDLPIKCIDCNQDFLWTIGEQAFYRDKGLENPPKRCKPCKKAKTRRLDLIEKAKLTGKRHVMEIRAECARCKQATTIPFYPSQGKPVYCRSCFLELKSEAFAGATP